MTTPTPAQNNNNRTWLVVAKVLVPVLIAGGGGAWALVQRQVTQHDVELRQHGERIRACEMAKEELLRGQDRIEHKLDRLLDSKP